MDKKREEYKRRAKETGHGRAAEDVLARFKAMDEDKRLNARRLMFVLMMDVARNSDEFMHMMIVSLLAGELGDGSIGITTREFNRIFGLPLDDEHAELATTIVNAGAGEADEFARRLKQLDQFMLGGGTLEDMAQLQKVINKWLTGEGIE